MGFCQKVIEKRLCWKMEGKSDGITADTVSRKSLALS